MSDKPVVGVDVSKEWLDLCWRGESVRIANSAAAITAWLDRVDPALVALEPTGGYERPLLAALRERAIPALRVHPNRLVAFRRARGIAAKTDRIDAALILAFATDLLARQEVPPSLPSARGCASWRRAGASWLRRCTPSAAASMSPPRPACDTP